MQDRIPEMSDESEIKEDVITPIIEAPTEPVTPIEEATPTEPVTPIEVISSTEAVTPAEAISPTEAATPADVSLEQPRKRKRFSFWWGLITGLLIALLIGAAGYFFILRPGSLPFNKKESVTSDSLGYLNDPSLYDEEDEEEEAADEFIPDTAVMIPEITANNEAEKATVETEEKTVVKEEIAKTEPSDKIVKDVIGPNNYLTTMAQRHYGDFNLWPYIYEENKRFLGHPDRIKPGTEVVIPSLTKYGVDPKNPKDIRQAKNLGVEIYKRYSK